MNNARYATVRVIRCVECPFYSSAYGDCEPWCQKKKKEAPWHTDANIPTWCPLPKQEISKK